MRNTISGKAAITAVAVTISAGLAPVVSIAATGFFAPRKVNPSDKLSLYGSATVADLPDQPGSGALAVATMTYEWSTSPQLNLSHANVTGGGGPWRRSLFLLPYALQLSAGTYP